jgi:Tfp pilus assembly protein PilV
MKAMPTLRINFANRPAWRELPILALCAALVLTVGILANALNLAAQASALQTRADQLDLAQRKLMKERSRAPQSAAARDQASVADAIGRDLATPWGAVFYAIEQNTGSDVSLLNITSSPTRAQLTLDGEARSLSAMLDFLKRLQGEPIFRTIELVGHHVDPADSLQAVRFTLLLRWRGSA